MYEKGKKSKILYLMKILLECTDDENGLTANELIDALAEYGIRAERKTLYSDVETLCEFGLDIEMRKNKSVRYHLVSRNFELPELKLLVDAVQASKFITHKKSLELISKLEGLASRHQARELGRQVFVSGRIKTMNESIYYAVDYIHAAINGNTGIAFQYFDWNEEKKRQLRHEGKLYTVSPWALTWDDENYYMIAYDSDECKIKHYRVDKMVNLRVLDTPRDGKSIFEDFDMALYSRKTFGMFGGEEVAVTLRCENRMASIMIDRFGQDVTFIKADDSHFDLHVKVAVSPLFFTWIMNFGGGVKLISPDGVKEQLVALAEGVVAQYREG